MAAENKIGAVAVNGKDFSKLFKGKGVIVSDTQLVPRFLEQEGTKRRSVGFFTFRGQRLSVVADALKSEYRQYLHGNVSDEKLDRIIGNLEYFPGREFASHLSKVDFGFRSWQRFADRAKGDPDLLNDLRALHILYELPHILAEVDEYLSAIFLNVSYIGPARATGQRYYRIQDLAIDQIDPKGENLAMFLYSLRFWEKSSFSDWAKQYLQYEVLAHQNSGHISIMLKEPETNYEFNLADTGYGFSQLLPVLAQIWTQTHREPQPIRAGAAPRAGSPAVKLIALEQPELHLHPALQSLLAKALGSSIYRQDSPEGATQTLNDVRFLVETHSEALINRIGQSVYEGELRAQDVAIYVFDRDPDTSITNVRKASFSQAGELQNWPYGFFISHQK